MTTTYPNIIDGARDVTLKGDRIAEEFQAIVENYVRRRYGVARIQKPAAEFTLAALMDVQEQYDVVLL